MLYISPKIEVSRLDMDSLLCGSYIYVLPSDAPSEGADVPFSW